MTLLTLLVSNLIRFRFVFDPCPPPPHPPAEDGGQRGEGRRKSIENSAPFKSDLIPENRLPVLRGAVAWKCYQRLSSDLIHITAWSEPRYQGIDGIVKLR